MLRNNTLNAAKFSQAPTKNVWDINCQKISALQKSRPSSPNFGNKCSLARPLTTTNFVALRQEVCKISAVENLCYSKKWTKVHQTRRWPATHKCLLSCEVSSCLLRCTRKALQIFAKLQKFWKICAPWKSRPKLTKFWEQMSICKTPNQANFRCALTRTVQDICYRKFGLPEKWTKVHQNRRRPAKHKCPSSCQISSCSSEWCTRKALQKILHPSVFWHCSLDQSSSVLSPMYSKAPSINRPNCVPFWKPLHEISADKLPPFSWGRDPQKTVNDIVSTYHAVTKKQNSLAIQLTSSAVFPYKNSPITWNATVLCGSSSSYNIPTQNSCEYTAKFYRLMQ